MTALRYSRTRFTGRSRSGALVLVEDRGSSRNQLRDLSRGPFEPRRIIAGQAIKTPPCPWPPSSEDALLDKDQGGERRIPTHVRVEAFFFASDDDGGFRA